MKKILEGPSRRVGTIFQEIDANFIEVCNSILCLVFPDHTLKDYAETAPAAPNLFDSYLVREDATVWEIEVLKNQIIAWNGAEWELLPYKITEINAALQFFYFDADKIHVNPIQGLIASEVQGALSEITAALVTAGIIIPAPGSGSV